MQLISKIQEYEWQTKSKVKMKDLFGEHFHKREKVIPTNFIFIELMKMIVNRQFAYRGVCQKDPNSLDLPSRVRDIGIFNANRSAGILVRLS